jgi:hypothetical protein
MLDISGSSAHTQKLQPACKTPYQQLPIHDIYSRSVRSVCLHLGIQKPTMSSDDRTNPLTESSMTIPSDSEQYSGNDDISPSPPSSSSSPPMILYRPPTLWGLLRGAAINLLLPFINGLMLGFGELFAHEAAFRLGWGGTKVWISYSCHPAEHERRKGMIAVICAALCFLVGSLGTSSWLSSAIVHC